MDIDGNDLTITVAYMPRRKYDAHLPWTVFVGDQWTGVEETNFPSKEEAYTFAINTLKRGAAE